MVCDIRCGDWSDTSTVALQDVRGDEQGTQCLGGTTDPPCSWGVIKYGDLALKVEPETVTYGRLTRRTRTHE
jgi:hypothetical protein